MKRAIFLILIAIALGVLVTAAAMAASFQDQTGISDLKNYEAINLQSWIIADPQPPVEFVFTRFDGVFVAGDEPWGNKVYFMGGRSGSSTEDPTIWRFDPVTGVYADTGADMVEDVSNYTANLIEDDGTGQGPAIYLIGGYDADNAVDNIGMIQRYYPQINLVEALPEADNWTVTVAGNMVGAMGTASIGNQIYVFGGWENITAPYFYDGTWIFDPTEPSGSRWTQLSDVITPARSYIQVAVQGGIIYAMGGIMSYDGSDLAPTDIVEAYDTSDPGAGWYALAPMPVASGEGRGFGFEVDTLGVDQPWAGHVYVVGGGDWPDPTNEAMEYLVGSDSWDTGFPNLNNARRDQAGVYVPICSEDPEDGLPGMWVFGGRMTSDTPPFGPTEYYPMSCAVEPQVSLIPSYQDGSAIPGEIVSYNLTLLNQTGMADTFDITYSGVFTITGPALVGPVDDGASEEFEVQVEVPLGINCFESDIGLITATSQNDPGLYFDTANVETIVMPGGMGGIDGAVVDANTGLGIENALVYVYLGDLYYETYSGIDGLYTIPEIEACTYEGVANATGYFNKYGMEVDVMEGDPIMFDITLDASWPVLSRAPVDVVIPPDSFDTYMLTLDNHGSGDLFFHITEVPSGTYPLPLYEDPTMPKGVDPQVYSDLADSANGVTKFIVYLRQQADLSAAYDMDWNARGQYVLDTLRDVANQTQARLAKELDERTVPYSSLYIVNAIVVEGDINLVDYLAAIPEVRYIGPNTAVPEPAPVSIEVAAISPDTIEWNIQKIAANQVWTDFSVFGEGIVLSSIDTGVQWDHPALINQYRGWDGANADHNYNWWDPYGQNTTIPTDAAGHGTHTMGTMLGSDDPADPVNAPNAIGVAPGAKWLACDGFDNNTGYGYDAELLECAQFLLAPWDLNGSNPDPSMRPDIINNSWGGGQAQWWYNQAIYAWRAAGIMGVFSIGNPGSACGMAGSPGDGANMIGVGATNSADTIASFSGRGPAAITGITKPDVSAPGVNIRSSIPGSNYQGGWNGTSMAAPHVSGTTALIWSAVPELRGDVQLTIWIIEQTAFGITTNEGCGGDLPDEIPNNTYGWGRINAFYAVTMALANDWDTPWLEVEPLNGTVAPGTGTDIALFFDTTGLTFGECYMTDLKFEYNDPYIIEQVVPVEVCIGIPMHNFLLPLVNK